MGEAGAAFFNWYLVIAAGQLAIVAAGFVPAMRRRSRALFLYLGFAMGVFGLTAPKVGSDSNYQIEMTVLLILCAVVALDALDFFPLVFQGSKKWVTLLQVPLAIHMVLNLRDRAGAVSDCPVYGYQQYSRGRWRRSRGYLADGGRVLSSDLNGVEHLRGRLEVEPLIYSLLVRAGRIDPEPVRRDIAAKKFSTIMLFRDVNKPFDTDLELLDLTDAQLDEVRKHYRQVALIPGPYQLRIRQRFNPSNSCYLTV